jgi:hypothetical protein
MSPKERASLIAVGHSAGCGTMYVHFHPVYARLESHQATEISSRPIPYDPEDPNYKPPILGFILVEASWMHRSVRPIMQEMSRRVWEKGPKRPQQWPSATAAIADLRRFSPCKRWHPEVLQAMEVRINIAFASLLFFVIDLEVGNSFPPDVRWRCGLENDYRQ